MKTPTVRSVLGDGLPRFLREGFLPLAAFYLGDRLGGLALGVAAAGVVSVGEFLLARRAGHTGLLVRLTFAFVLVQSVAGLVADSTTVYLAAPLVPIAVWGVAFLISALTPRPLAGALATAWYPFPDEYRASTPFVRVFRVQSLVWATVILGRGALRLTLLLTGADIGGYVALSFLTGAPLTFATLAWSIRHAIANLPEPDPDEMTTVTND